MNPPVRDADLSDLDSLEVIPSFPHLSDDDGLPTRTEIFDALRRLKNHKSPGVDDITNEQLKYGASGLMDKLETNMISKVWETEAVPSDRDKGIALIVPKKGDTSICSNNRGITLRSTASKLCQIIVLQRMSDGLEAQLRENQCGFRKNRSCINQIYTLRYIIGISSGKRSATMDYLVNTSEFCKRFFITSSVLSDTQTQWGANFLV